MFHATVVASDFFNPFPGLMEVNALIGVKEEFLGIAAGVFALRRPDGVIGSGHLQFAQSGGRPRRPGPPHQHRHFSPEVFFCVFFHRTEEAISLVAQVAVIFCLLVQLDGGGGCGRRARGECGGEVCSRGIAAILLVKIKAFFFYFAVTSCHLSANK